MIESTFILLNGIGEATERKLWEHGVAGWQTFLGELSLPGIGRSRKRLYDLDVSRALHHHGHDDARYFAECLKPRDQWRLYHWLRSRAVYLDMETAGGAFGDVTVVGLFGEGGLTSLVLGGFLTQDRWGDERSRCDLVI